MPTMALPSMKRSTIGVTICLIFLIPTIITLSVILTRSGSTMQALVSAFSHLPILQDRYVKPNQNKVYLISIGTDAGPLEYRYVVGNLFIHSDGGKLWLHTL